MFGLRVETCGLVNAWRDVAEYFEGWQSGNSTVNSIGKNPWQTIAKLVEMNVIICVLCFLFDIYWHIISIILNYMVFL